MMNGPASTINSSRAIWIDTTIVTLAPVSSAAIVAASIPPGEVASRAVSRSSPLVWCSAQPIPAQITLSTTMNPSTNGSNVHSRRMIARSNREPTRDPSSR